MRILIVDDDRDLRLLFRLGLSQAGYDVIEASNGEQAIERAIDSLPALILLDVMMPGLGGLETCRQLKIDDRTRTVPVIFVTAMDDLATRSEAVQAGAVDYIVKPISTVTLIDRVRQVIQQ